MVDEQWALIQYIEDGEVVYTLWIDEYDVARYEKYPSEEEILRDIHIFNRGFVDGL